MIGFMALLNQRLSGNMLREILHLYNSVDAYILYLKDNAINQYTKFLHNTPSLSMYIYKFVMLFIDKSQLKMYFLPFCPF
jgi:hypothetical protein